MRNSIYTNRVFLDNICKYMQNMVPSDALQTVLLVIIRPFWTMIKHVLPTAK